MEGLAAWALVIDVNEAYTSKTRSWDGSIKSNLGGAIVIRDESGFGMDRDVNGARGIFLRALGDSPFLRELLAQVASQSTLALGERWLAFNYRHSLLSSLRFPMIF